LNAFGEKIILDKLELLIFSLENSKNAKLEILSYKKLESNPSVSLTNA